MTYKVSVHKGNGIYFTVAAFNEKGAAVKYAEEKTAETGEYHLVEVVDGGKH